MRGDIVLNAAGYGEDSFVVTTDANTALSWSISGLSEDFHTHVDFSVKNGKFHYNN